MYSLRTSAACLAGLAAGWFGLALPARAQTAPYPQRYINEIAAACVSTEMALSGLKGSPRPGETHVQFVARIKSYLAALQRAVQETAPLRRPPAPADQSPANRQAWARMAGLARQLPGQVADARKAWDSYPRLQLRAHVGPALGRCLDSVHGLLDLLRNARP